MNILAIETTDRTGSLAALVDEVVLRAIDLDPSQRSAQSFAPALKKLLAEVGWRPADVRLTAVAVGPGSFTGLRVGVTAAKTFAFAAGCEVLGVNALEAIGFQAGPFMAQNGAEGAAWRLWTVIDAQRQQVFCARFSLDAAGGLHEEVPATILDQDAWLKELSAGDFVSGPALKKLQERLPAGVRPVAEALWAPTAVAVGQLARLHYGAGRRDDLWQLTPLYLRKSAAEEQRDRL